MLKYDNLLCDTYSVAEFFLFVSLQILLVSGSKHPDKWVVPGGGIEPTEDTGVAAVREAMEEAGVNGILGRFLGVFEVSHILLDITSFSDI